MKPELHSSKEPQKEPDLTSLEAFEQIFWAKYPRKIAKHEARKAWLKLALEDSDQDTLDHIMRGLEYYLEKEWELDRPLFIPYPATWLNQRRWEDVE